MEDDDFRQTGWFPEGQCPACGCLLDENGNCPTMQESEADDS